MVTILHIWPDLRDYIWHFTTTINLELDTCLYYYYYYSYFTSCEDDSCFILAVRNRKNNISINVSTNVVNCKQQ